jgi:TolA-binding protein
MIPRHFFNGASAIGVVTALFFFARLILTPDPGADFFNKAQRLEAAGQTSLALRHYRLVSDKTPESLFAPRALLREGDLLAAQGRQKADKAVLKQAVAAYALLAKNYPTDTLAGEALFDAAQISTELNDFKAARGFYAQILKNNSPKSDASALATLKIGRLALQQNDKAGAQKLFQRVLQNWPRNALVGAEAQFHLGVAYETLFKNRDWATRAYDATIARYPTSTWANNARGRLGLLAFADTKGRRPARRVRIDVVPFADDSDALTDAASPWNALRPLLAARGVEIDDATLRAWSLTPFWTVVDKRNPGRVVQPSFDAFENVVANAGLRFTIKGGGREAEALKDLKDDLDDANTLLAWSEIEGRGRWALVVGYDSERDEVMLQSGGARFETLASKTFAAGWKAPSKFGKPYTLLSFFSDAEKNRPAPQLTPTPEPSPRPNQTPLPI